MFGRPKRDDEVELVCNVCPFPDTRLVLGSGGPPQDSRDGAIGEGILGRSREDPSAEEDQDDKNSHSMNAILLLLVCNAPAPAGDGVVRACSSELGVRHRRSEEDGETGCNEPVSYRHAGVILTVRYDVRKGSEENL